MSFSIIFIINTGFFKDVSESGYYFAAFYICCSGSRNQHKIIIAVNICGASSYSFTDNTLCPVAFYCTADLFSNRYPKAGKSRAVFYEINYQRRTDILCCAVINTLKFPVLI